MAQPVNMNFNTSVQKVIDFCSLHTSLQTFFNVGGLTGEPGLTICNNVLQMLFVRAAAWKFNRVDMSGTTGNFLVTQYGVQDYLFGGACAFVLQQNGNSPIGGVGIDLAANPMNGGIAGVSIASNVVTVQTLDPHPFQVGSTVFHSGLTDSKLNSTFTFDPMARTSAWTGGRVITSVPDNKHYTFAAPSGTVATITAIAISNNIVTVTASNTLVAGEVVLFAGLGTATYLNGKTATVLSAASTNFTVRFVHANVSNSDTGNASVVTGAPGFGTTDTTGALTGLPGFGWMESASVQQITSTTFPQPVDPISAVHTLPPAYTNNGNKLQVCMMIDYNNGVCKFRLSQPVGVQCKQINFVYQARAPKLISPQSVFPWPDDMSYVLYEVALFQGFRYAKGVNEADTRTQMQIAMQTIQTALVGEDREENAHIVAPDRGLM